MRVISGSARGRRLIAPQGQRVRPTADRVKESLFSILVSITGNFEGMKALDLFCGTGSLGIEALSRGCGAAVFVDSHRDSIALVRKNLELTGFTGQGRILAREAVAAIGALEREGSAFHLVFLDPPYRLGLVERLLERLAASPLLGATPVVVAETASDEEPAETFGPLRQFDRRVYGDTALSFYRKGTDSDHA